MPDRLHTHAAILSTGDELVMGQLQDTNARWLAERLTERGVRVAEAAMVGDDTDTLVAALKRLCAVAPLVVMSGGLGATDGDLTRQAICAATGDSLVTDDTVARALTAYLKSRGRDATNRQLRQAQRPSRASLLPNAVGMAPGLHATVGDADVICLPGPPGELRPMWRNHVEPLLRPDPARAVRTHLLYVVGVPEADAADRLKLLTARGQDITVNMTASGGILTIRTRAEGLQASSLVARFEQTLAAVRAALGDRVIAESSVSDAPSSEALARAVLESLKSVGQRLASVESCTGGMLGQMLTAIPGSSAAYLGGVVTYDNELKVALAGVPQQILVAHGAVSGETATAMARGGLGRTGADHALAITGVAGPDGGSVEKPVGTVWIAHASRTAAGVGTDVRCFRFTGDRHDIRVRASTTALIMLLFHLLRRDPGRLLWQHVP